jgi:hypothetical protein
LQQPEVPASFLSEHWGDIASVAGVVISIVGFVVTIINVARSKRAAQRAEEAANAARESIMRSDTLVELSTALSMMDELKRLHRANAWSILPDRYALLKRHLVSIRTANPQFTDDHQSVLQSAIQHFSDMEKRVEKTLTSRVNAPNIATLNEIVSIQIDRINEILAVFRQEIGRVDHGRPQAPSISAALTQKNP